MSLKRMKKRIAAVITAIVVMLSLCATFTACKNVQTNSQTNAQQNEDEVNEEYIVFGTYEQDAKLRNGQEDLEWLVLKKEENRVLVISRYGIQPTYYYLKPEQFNPNSFWGQSALRYFFYENYYKSAFSAEEKEMIQITTNRKDAKPMNGTETGIDVCGDYAFPLSVEEVNQYFTSDRARQCQGTVFCESAKAEIDKNGNCCWWLLSPGNDEKCAAYVGFDGAVNESGCDVTSEAVLRPALWISLNSEEDLDALRSNKAKFSLSDDKKILTVTGEGLITGSPENYKTIRDYSDSIEEIIIGEGITDLRVKFSEMGALKKVVLPESLVSIGQGVFQGCDSLSEINLPSSLKKIKQSAFSGCKSLTDIDLPNGIEVIEADAFAETAIQVVILPESIKEFDGYAFSDELREIHIPASIQKITIADKLRLVDWNGSHLDVYFGGTRDEWIALGQSDNNTTVHYGEYK